MTNSNLRVVTPITENRTVTPLRAPNAELRTREHLTADEVEKLIEAAKANRYGYRDALMVLLAYRHGLRAAEVVDVRCGSRSTSKPRPCTSGGPRTAPRPPILSAGVRCASSVAISGKARNPRLCLSQSAAHRYRRPSPA
jgi:integrase